MQQFSFVEPPPHAIGYILPLPGSISASQGSRMPRTSASRDISRLFGLATAVTAVAALYWAKVVLLPLALAVLLSFLLAPLVRPLERIHVPRLLAIVVVLAGFGSAVGYVGWIFIGQLISLTNHLPDYRTNIEHKITLLHHTPDNSLTRAEKEVDRLSRELGISDAATTRRRYIPRGSSAERPMVVKDVSNSGPSMSTVHSALDPLGFGLLIVVFTFFMLLQREDLRNRVILLTGQDSLSTVTQAMDDAGSRVSRYFALQALVNTCYGTIIFLAMHWIGLPHAVFWGALAGLLRFIPYAGAPVAGLLPTIFSMAVFEGWSHTLAVMAVFFVLEVVTANFVEPRVYGRHTGLSSLAILVAAVFWTLVWGPIGLILSVPLTVCLGVVGSHVSGLEFLEILLGDRPPMRPSTRFYQRLLAEDEHEARRILKAYRQTHSLLDLFDDVIIPALALAERDRHRDALEEPSLRFIHQTTGELIDEFSLPAEDNAAASSSDATNLPDQPTPDAAEVPGQPAHGMILCVPVRDFSDELVAKMLSHLLEQAGHPALYLPVGELPLLPAKVASLQPTMVYLSALPPYAIASARSVYRSLRRNSPEAQIAIGLWEDTDDPSQAAKDIRDGEGSPVLLTLAQSLQYVQDPATMAVANAR